MTNQHGEGDETSREICERRCYRAPRHEVYRMWTDAGHVVQWWGPFGFTTTVQAMQVEPGGEWRLVLRGPDGRDYPNRSVYREVRPGERLVYDHVSGPLFRMEASFDETPDGTEVTSRMVFDSAAQRDHVVRQFNAVEGLQQMLERLDGYLTKLQAEEAQ